MKKKNILFGLCSALILTTPVMTSAVVPVAYAQTVATKATTKKQVTVPKVSMDYATAITKTGNYIAAESSQDVWNALALVRSGIQLTKDQRQAMYDQFAQDVKVSEDSYITTTDYEKAVIGIVSVGGDPTNVDGVNLLDQFTAKIDASKNPSITELVYGVLDLDLKDFGATYQAKSNDYIAKILAKQNASGCWALFGSGNDLDITGMVLTALAGHRDQATVINAVNKAVTFLKTDAAFVSETGGFFIKSAFSSYENSSSVSQVVIGLAANGIDLATEFVGNQGQNPISRLLAYQQSDGSIRWKFDDNSGAIGMSTQQGLHALEQYAFMKKGQGRIYDFIKNPVASLNETPTPNPEPTKTLLPDVQAALVNGKTNLTTLVDDEIKGANFTGSDLVFSAGRSGVLTQKQKQALYDALIKQEKEGNIDAKRPNDLARIILSMKAIGIDPTHFAKRNLVAELAANQNVMSFGSQIAATALLALSSDDYTAVTGVSAAKIELVNGLVTDSAHYEGNVWGYQDYQDPTKYVADVDITGFVLAALGTYQATETTRSVAVDLTTTFANGLNFIKGKVTSEGNIGSNYDPSDTGNVNTTAMGVLGLTLTGTDVETVKGVKEVNLGEGLIGFQEKDGSYKTTYSQAMATGQATTALLSYVYDQTDKGNIYDFKTNPVAPFKATATKPDGNKEDKGDKEDKVNKDNKDNKETKTDKSGKKDSNAKNEKNNNSKEQKDTKSDKAKLPQTGEKVLVWVSVLGSITIGLGSLLWFLSKK